MTPDGPPGVPGQMARLRECAHPADLDRLKLDLLAYGACYLDDTGRRVDPLAAPPVPARPLTEATPAAAAAHPVTGWYVAQP